MRDLPLPASRFPLIGAFFAAIAIFNLPFTRPQPGGAAAGGDGSIVSPSAVPKTPGASVQGPVKIGVDHYFFVTLAPGDPPAAIFTLTLTPKDNWKMEIPPPAAGETAASVDVEVTADEASEFDWAAVPTGQIEGESGAAEGKVIFLPFEIVTQTEAMFPADRGRKTVGVGEVVFLTLNIPAADFPAGLSWTWSLDPAAGAGELKLNAVEAAQATYLAPASAANPEVKVSFAPGQSTVVQFDVIEPTGLVFVKEGREYHALYASTGEKSIGMFLHPGYYLLPDTVNFEYLRTYEGFAEPAKAGYFIGSSHLGHPANGPHAHVDYIGGKGNRGNAEENDGFDYDRFQTATDGATHADGKISWTCDWEYEVFRYGEVVGERTKFDTVTMSLELEESGTNITATIKKGEAAYSNTFTRSELE